MEDTFKTTKALLTTRPIFHKTDAAIRDDIFCSFLAVLLRKELFDRLAARRHGDLEWQHIVDDLDEFSEVAVEQDGRRALLRTAPGATIDPLCRALGITLPPVFQEIPARGRTSQIVWCLGRFRWLAKPLMHNYIYFETLEVGSDGVRSTQRLAAAGDLVGLRWLKSPGLSRGRWFRTMQLASNPSAGRKRLARPEPVAGLPSVDCSARANHPLATARQPASEADRFAFRKTKDRSVRAELPHTAPTSDGRI